jgi:hypothetical protein
MTALLARPAHGPQRISAGGVPSTERGNRQQRPRHHHGGQPQQHPRQTQGGVTEHEVVRVYGDDTTPNVRMFPVPAAASCSDSDVWTPSRLRQDDAVLVGLLGQLPAADGV